jgi:hypothetical protein
VLAQTCEVEASVTLEGKVMSGNNVRKMTDFIK